jgi:phage-related protein
MGDNELSGKVGLDTTDFKTGVAAMNREIRVIESGFRASAAALGDWANDASGLEMRIEALTKKLDVQRTKVEAVRKEYERVKAEKGENSRAAQDLEIKLNRETETLNKMERELGDTNNALEEMKGDSERAAKGVDKLDEKQKQATRSSLTLKGAMKALGTGIKSTLGFVFSMTKAIVGMTAVVAGLAIGLVAFTVGPASDLNETISKTEVVFGSAADKVLEFGETSAEALGLSKNAALGAASTYGNLLRAMGLTENESADMSTSLVQLAADLASFNNLETADVLDKLRAGLTGEAEPLKQLGVNMNQARIQAKALELGLVGVDGELTAAAKAQAAYAIILEDTTLAQGDFARTSDGLANQQRELQARFENIRAEIGTALLPVVTTLVTQLNDFLASDVARAGLETLTGLIGDLGANLENFNLGEFLGNLAGGLVEGRANLANIGLDILTGLVDGITQSIPGLFATAQEILGKLVEFLTSGLPVMIEAGVPLLLSLVTGILEALPMIVDAALQIIIALATGLTQALPALIPTLVQTIITIVETLVENLPMLIDAALQLILALAQGLILALPILIEALPQIVDALLNGIFEALPLLLDAAGQLIGMLATGIIMNIPVLLEAVGQIIFSLGKALAEFIRTMPDIGKQILQGIWKGVEQAASWFNNKLSGWLTDMVSNVRNALGMHSPPAFALEIGESIPEGIWQELSRGMPTLQRQLSGAMRSLSADATVSANMAGAGAGAGRGGSMSVSIGDIIVQVGGTSASPAQIEQATSNGVLRALRAAGGA